MDEVYELGRFFPNGVPVDLLDDYVGHHLLSASKCVESELYSSAYPHLHLLYMTFVYIQLLRIAREKQQDFEFSLIGFSKIEQGPDVTKDPFVLANINERSVFRLFKLVGFDKEDIDNAASLIKSRNERLHAKGQVYCLGEQDFRKELLLYLSKMRFVIKKQRRFLDDIYLGLVKTYKDDDYVITSDDIENNFIDQYLFSEYELVLLSSGRKDKISEFVNEKY